MSRFRGKGGSKTKPLHERLRGGKRDVSNVPDSYDLEAWKQRLQGHTKSLVHIGEGLYKAKHLTDAQLKEMIRSAFRERWMRCPIKLAFLEYSREPDYNPSTRTVSKWQCNSCGNMFKETEVNVDHINPVGSLDLDDIVGYAERMLNVGFNDLQILCEECHDIKTLQESKGCSFEEAKIYKEINTRHLTVSNKPHKDYCVSLGATEKEARNKESREIFLFNYIKERM